MSPLSIGVGLAAVLAGPPLYTLLQRGDIDLTTAMLRGGLVALGCVLGASLVMRIVDGYEREHRVAAARRRQEALLEALQEVENARKQQPPRSM